MKSLITMAVILGVGLTTTLNAKKLPTVAVKLPSNMKETIADKLNYPKKAEMSLIEGDVWLKVCMTEESVLKIVDLSATNPLLGEYVKKELGSLYVENPGCNTGQVFFLKIKFDLTEIE